MGANPDIILPMRRAYAFISTILAVLVLALLLAKYALGHGPWPDEPVFPILIVVMVLFICLGRRKQP